MKVYPWTKEGGQVILGVSIHRDYIAKTLNWTSRKLRKETCLRTYFPWQPPRTVHF